MNKLKKGFTLVELVVAMAVSTLVLSIGAMLVTFVSKTTQSYSKENSIKEEITYLQNIFINDLDSNKDSIYSINIDENNYFSYEYKDIKESTEENKVEYKVTYKDDTYSKTNTSNNEVVNEFKNKNKYKIELNEDEENNFYSISIKLIEDESKFSVFSRTIKLISKSND